MSARKPRTIGKQSGLGCEYWNHAEVEMDLPFPYKDDFHIRACGGLKEAHQFKDWLSRYIRWRQEKERKTR